MGTYLLPAQTTLDASGAGSVTITARHPLAVFHTRVSTSTRTKEPTALIYVNGVELEGSYSGGGDQSTTAYNLAPSDTVECRWTGGDPGAVARLIVRGS